MKLFVTPEEFCDLRMRLDAATAFGNEGMSRRAIIEFCGELRIDTQRLLFRETAVVVLWDRKSIPDDERLLKS